LHAEIPELALHRLTSSLHPFYGLVQCCLDLIQQNPLPTGEPRAGVTDNSQMARADRGQRLGRKV